MHSLFLRDCPIYVLNLVIMFCCQISCCQPWACSCTNLYVADLHFGLYLRQCASHVCRVKCCHSPWCLMFYFPFHFHRRQRKVKSHVGSLCFVMERTDGWGMVRIAFCFLLQADLVPERVCMYFFIWFRDQDLISPGQTGTIVCEDCCCCYCWATTVLVCWLQGRRLHLRWCSADLFSEDDYVMPCSNIF